MSKKFVNKYCLHLCLTMFIEFDYIINQEPHNLSRLRCVVTKQNKHQNIQIDLVFNTIIYTMLNICPKIKYMPKEGFSHLEENEVAFYRNQ